MSGSCAVRGRRFAQPCRKNWPICPGPSCSSEPHSSLPGPAALEPWVYAGRFDIRPAAWLMAAVALFLLAVAGYALLVHAFPQYYWTQIDTGVYRDGGIAVRNQPTMLYALELGTAKLPFTYTPFAALLFAA